MRFVTRGINGSDVYDKEAWTKDIVTLAKKRAEKFGVRNVLVSTNSGATANHVYETFDPDYQIFAVGNPASAHEKGLVIHSGVSEETRKRLEAEGIKVILQDQSIGQAVGIGKAAFPIGGEDFDIWGRCFQYASLQEVIKNSGPTGEFNAVAIIIKTLHRFGDGVSVCVEVTLMAADSGELPLDEDCIAIARPSEDSGLPHTAMVIRPAKKEDFFKYFRIKDVILVPGLKDRWFKDDSPFFGVGTKESQAGLLVTEVVPWSAAEKAGIKVSDTIVEVDGKKVEEPSSFGRVIGVHKAGDQIVAKIIRGKETLQLKAILGRRQ